MIKESAMQDKYMQRFIVALCVLGIGYYCVKIFFLKDDLRLTQKGDQLIIESTKAQSVSPIKRAAQTRLVFTMESRDVDLVQKCFQVFESTREANQPDNASLESHPNDEKKAILKVERFFSSSQMQQTLAIKKQLQDLGCFKGVNDDTNTFVIEAIKPIETPRSTPSSTSSIAPT